MYATKKISGMIAVLIGLSFLFAMIPSEAAEIKFFKQQFGQSQERMGREIMQAAWLKWNYGTTQEKLGSFIQTGASKGRFVQEELGSGITAAAHLKWEGMRAQERIGQAIAGVSAVIKKEARVLGPEVIQERMGAAILARAQSAHQIRVENQLADRLTFGARQEQMGRAIQVRAGVNWTGSMMAQRAYDALEGRNPEAIPFAMFATLRSAKAFEQEQNFRLAMGLLAAETGLPMTAILPKTVSGSSTGSGFSSAGVASGWGGFGEFGIWSILSFLYVGYLFGLNAYALAPQGRVDERPWIYQKAA